MSPTGTIRLVNRELVLLVPVIFVRQPTQAVGWQLGPGPFSHAGQVATREARKTYYHDRACRALYGTDEQPVRWHRSVEPGETHGQRELLGLELLAYLPKKALLIVHLRLTSDLDAALEELYRCHQIPPDHSGERSWLNGQLGNLGEVDPEAKRATTLTLVTTHQAELPRRLPEEQFPDWDANHDLMWLLASASSPDDYMPDPAAGEPDNGTTVHLSTDWRALVLRDGAAFLGLRADQGQDDKWFPSARMYFHSIYTDAFALAFIQRTELARLADQVAELDDPVEDPGRLQQLELKLSEYRNRFWWHHLTSHGPANSLIRAYATQHQLEPLLEQVKSDLEDYSRQAQTLAAERTSAILGVATVLGLPAGVAIGLLQALDESSPGTVWPAVGITLVVSLLVLALAVPQWVQVLTQTRPSEDDPG